MNATYVEHEARRRTVLVAVMNNREDWRRVAEEGWYRIPQRRAPRRIGADFLALYQTGAFRRSGEAHTVTYFAPTRRYQLLTRAEMMPQEADHPRAQDYYFRIEVGPLERLMRPVPAATMRRITFIHTTLARLLHADDVRDLFLQDDPFERLWQALRDARLRPLPNRVAGDRPLDITLRARGGYLGINCDEATGAREQRPLPERWSFVTLAPQEIERDLPGCLRKIGAA
ncbi:MAG: hypothetical protein KDD83_05070, partial [Caldilineaceae bacterium]|nr:hypothetical protein [Caldilineaceae bacterium]